MAHVAGGFLLGAHGVARDAEVRRAQLFVPRVQRGVALVQHHGLPAGVFPGFPPHAGDEGVARVETLGVEGVHHAPVHGEEIFGAEVGNGGDRLRGENEQRHHGHRERDGCGAPERPDDVRRAPGVRAWQKRRGLRRGEGKGGSVVARASPKGTNTHRRRVQECCGILFGFSDETGNARAAGRGMEMPYLEIPAHDGESLVRANLARRRVCRPSERGGSLDARAPHH